MKSVDSSKLNPAELSSYQKQHLFDQGWVVIPQVIPLEMVREARRPINIKALQRYSLRALEN